MKTCRTIATLVILASLSSAVAANLPYFQNFDSMGTTGTTMPLGWSFWTIAGGSSSATPPTSAEMATAILADQPLMVWNQGDPPATWNANAGNMGLAPSPFNNRLLGTSPSGNRGGLLQLSLNNDSGAAITTVKLSYDMVTMTPPPDAELPGYSFYYLDGSTWTPFPSLNLTDTGTVSAVITYANPVANGGTLEFRWFDDNSSATSPDAMIAIDNVLIVPEPATLGLLAVGALALISRRRKA